MVFDRKSLGIIITSLAVGFAAGRGIPEDIGLGPLKKASYNISEGALGRSLWVYDNNPIGMEAYVVVEDKEIPLELNFTSNKYGYANFDLPKDIFNTNKRYPFIVVDRDGNKTKGKIYTLGGLASTEPFIN